MTTTPLAKSWTTLEGQVAAVLVAAAAVGASLNPSAFPPKWAGVVATVVSVSLMVQRGFLKAVALKNPSRLPSVDAPPAETVVKIDYEKVAELTAAHAMKQAPR